MLQNRFSMINGPITGFCNVEWGEGVGGGGHIFVFDPLLTLIYNCEKTLSLKGINHEQ